MTLSDSMEDGSDSDSSLSDTPPDYYQAISGVDPNSDEEHVPAPDSQPANGFFCVPEDGIWSLDLNLNGVVEEEEEEEEERTMQASDSAVVRAFREDERRRNAPLPPENATRVMEAMRGISFAGAAPDWADQVPEDRWINQIRRMRQQPPQEMVEAMSEVSFPSPIQN